MYFGNEVQNWGSTPPALGPALKTDYPEVLNSARYYRLPNLALGYKDKIFTEGIRAVDPSFLEIFSFPLVQGDMKAALSGTYSIVLTEDISQKYFGNESPLGKILRVDDSYNFMVTGVLKTIPQNSFLQFDVLVPLAFCEEMHQNDRYLDIWDNYSFRTFVQLKKGVSFESFSEKISGRITHEIGWKFSEPYLRPLSSLHMHWLGFGGGNIQEVRIFTMIAFFVLFIACVNFMNLTTARSGNRAREIGLRKVVGALKSKLIKQFYCECILLTFLSFFIALLLVQVLLPAFNNLAGKSLSLVHTNNPALILSLLGVALFTGLLAGSYPSIFMASFQPSRILKGSFKGGSKSSKFRKILVVVQFALSIALITGTGIVSKQLNYIQEKNLGFEKEHLLYVPLKGELRDQWEPAKLAMLQDHNILNVSMVSHLPPEVYNNNVGWNWEGKDPETDPLVTKFSVDIDLLKTFKMEMKEGSYFSKNFTSGPLTSGSKIIINETFAGIMGLEHPVGSQISCWDEQFTVLGIIKDFHFKPLYQEIEPLVLFNDPEQFQYMVLRIHSDRISQTLDHIERIHNNFNSGFPFEYRFLDDDFDRLYRSEKNTGSLIRIFTALAILISCLGLFGLAAFMAEQRTKEIGVRKVLGASVPGIIFLLSREFTRWVLLANMIAWPLAFFFMKNWLQNFAYQIALGPGSFILAALMALGIASLTVSIQAIRAAQTNPTDALKYE
jgi:ABC-type antimicrobial peptide transport system permease subunit